MKLVVIFSLIFSYVFIDLALTNLVYILMRLNYFQLCGSAILFHFICFLDYGCFPILPWERLNISRNFFLSLLTSTVSLDGLLLLKLSSIFSRWKLHHHLLMIIFWRRISQEDLLEILSFYFSLTELLFDLLKFNWSQKFLSWFIQNCFTYFLQLLD